MKCINVLCFATALVLTSGIDVSEIEEKISSLEREVLVLRLDNALIKERLDDPSVRDVQTIGFFAVKNTKQNVTNGEIVAWDLLPSNPGDGFSLLTNSFVCPVGGYYFFQWNLYNDRGSEGQTCSGTLVLDGVNQARAHSRVQGSDLIALTTSQSAFVFCAAGQRATIQSDFNDNLVGEDGGRTSSFNGFLVYE